MFLSQSHLNKQGSIENHERARQHKISLFGLGVSQMACGMACGLHFSFSRVKGWMYPSAWHAACLHFPLTHVAWNWHFYTIEFQLDLITIQLMQLPLHCSLIHMAAASFALFSHPYGSSFLLQVVVAQLLLAWGPDGFEAFLRRLQVGTRSRNALNPAYVVYQAELSACLHLFFSY